MHVCYSTDMERHKCPACGRPHEIKLGMSDKERARKAALVRWGRGRQEKKEEKRPRMAVAMVGEREKVVKVRKGDMCPHGREYGRCIVETCRRLVGKEEDL